MHQNGGLARVVIRTAFSTDMGKRLWNELRLTLSRHTLAVTTKVVEGAEGDVGFPEEIEEMFSRRP